MPNPIKPKRSYTPSSVPTTSDLQTHELALNWNDGKVFTKDAAGNIVTWTLGSGGGGGGGGGEGEDTLLRSLFVPAAPTSVTASAGNAQAAVSWTAPTGTISQAPVTDYVVQYQPSGGSWATFSDGTSTSTSATVTGLANGTAYTFRVAAVNILGQGAWSTASAAVTPASAVYVAIPAMTSPTTPSGTTSADSWLGQVDGEPDKSWRAFDGTGVSWNSARSWEGYPFPHWVQYDFGGTPSRISGYFITATDTSFGNTPTSWTFSGSNDGVNFTTLDTRSDTLASFAQTSYTLAAPVAYSVYRWTFTAGQSAVLVAVQEVGVIQ